MMIMTATKATHLVVQHFALTHTITTLPSPTPKRAASRRLLLFYATINVVMTTLKKTYHETRPIKWDLQCCVVVAPVLLIRPKWHNFFNNIVLIVFDIIIILFHSACGKKKYEQWPVLNNLFISIFTIALLICSGTLIWRNEIEITLLRGWSCQ